ncbi:hypothetical protein [Neptuniibacter halophilus]|uniref:hypothetical protein n=1 Tax=Neptuniibacter halophilus TaxID=651666 RepID=UPI00257224B3|nr:hypothetical protein [Neptuniibacter halophilus]
MRVNVVVALLFGFCASHASAHSLFMECREADTDIHCQAGFSDGSSAKDLPFEVISYADQLLTSGEAKAEGFSFPLPQTDYFILLDAGPGHVVEVDMGEVSR